MCVCVCVFVCVCVCACVCVCVCLCVDVIAVARRVARVSTERHLEPGCSSIITNPSSVPRDRVRRGTAGRAVGTEFWRSMYWEERPRDTAERCTAAGPTHAGSGDEVQSAGTGSGCLAERREAEELLLCFY